MAEVSRCVQDEIDDFHELIMQIDHCGVGVKYKCHLMLRLLSKKSVNMS